MSIWVNGIPWVKNKIDLPKMLAKHMKETPNMTLDEFYDKYGVPKEARTDFGSAALLNQTLKYI